MTALPASRSCDWHAHEFYEPLIRARGCRQPHTAGCASPHPRRL
jgi:hypothetical protein